MKPTIPSGTRDFSPIEMARRNYIFNTIRSVFELYGYQQIETPSMEYLSTLLGKYGDEGDKLLFRILNSGDYFSDIPKKEINSDNAQGLANKISEKGLRYDLTVPFARYVVQHRNDITFPFKRFQIQPVWRADRPQKGRYREFYQCDADVVGSDSLLNEVELVQIIDEVFTRLGLDVTIKINNRKILAEIVQAIGHADKLVDITVAIDKYDKIGPDKVIEELSNKGLSGGKIAKLWSLIILRGDNSAKIKTIKSMLADNKVSSVGMTEIEALFDLLNHVDIQSTLEFDLKLARGLNYYTGAIFEVKANDVEMGSISGGGRYDNLTGIFGLEGISGVGISFGADRIYDVMNMQNKFPTNTNVLTKLLVANFGEGSLSACLKFIETVHQGGIAAELYPEPAKMKKQFSYADSRNIPFVAIIGEEELKDNVVSLKDMQTGEQKKMRAEELIKTINSTQ